MRVSVEYMNARRKLLHSTSGGTNYRKPANPVDQRTRDAELDAAEMLHEQVRLVFADFRAWFAESTNALRAGTIADPDSAIPF